MAGGNELSRVVLVDPLPDGGLRFEIVANEAERLALAERFGLLGLDRLAAAGRIVGGPLPGSIVVEGRLEATATQGCVVTLEPVAAEPGADFRRLFVKAPEIVAEIEIDPLGDDPEPLPGPRLDIGEIVAEELSLALDPYPRAAGIDAAAAADRGDGEPRGPFAGLARLRGG